jgi:pyruvate, water dikinase
VPDEVGEAYAALGDDPPVAVRSSACAEDSETASYAGQQETYLHVRGADAVRDRVRDCWASFFSERAIFYRQKKGSLDDLGMAVVVQRMVRADVAGVLFTCDPVRGRRDRMVVEAVLGLGEAAVSGQVTPDHYILKRDGTVRKAQVARQPFAVVPVEGGGVEERELGDEGGEQKLGEEQLRALARLGDDLEQRLGGPQDIEWALEGGELYVLQARPVTT